MRTILNVPFSVLAVKEINGMYIQVEIKWALRLMVLKTLVQR